MGSQSMQAQSTKQTKETMMQWLLLAWNTIMKKKEYDKAMAWYRLAAVKNNSWANNNIAALYHVGLGVPQDYLVALEWWLKAAIQKNKTAWENIGVLFKYGCGVPLDKYKALEWYLKSNDKPDKAKALERQGIQLTQQDKDKSIEQLIIETEDIFWEARMKAKEQLKEENAALQQLTAKLEQDLITKDSKLKSLKEEFHSLQSTSKHQQQEINSYIKSIVQYKSKEQTINSELHALKQTNHEVTIKMEAKDSKVTLLEKEIKLLQIASKNPSQGTTKIAEELKRSNQALERMSEQERQLKESQIEVIKGKMEISLEKEKQKRKNLEKENMAIKRELESFRASTQQKTLLGSNFTKNDSSSNNTDHNAEHVKCESDDNNDINYDTPNEEDDDDDNNDLNYDSDEQTKSRK